MMEANVAINTEFTGGVAHIVKDGGAVGDGLGFFPRTKRIAEGEHVGVGADAGVAEEIPGATDGSARFQNSVGLRGTLRLQVISSTNAGEASADDDGVEVIGGHGSTLHHDLTTEAWRPPSNRKTSQPRIATEELGLVATETKNNRLPRPSVGTQSKRGCGLATAPGRVAAPTLRSPTSEKWLVPSPQTISIWHALAQALIERGVNVT